MMRTTSGFHFAWLGRPSTTKTKKGRTAPGRACSGLLDRTKICGCCLSSWPKGFIPSVSLENTQTAFPSQILSAIELSLAKTLKTLSSGNGIILTSAREQQATNTLEPCMGSQNLRGFISPDHQTERIPSGNLLPFVGAATILLRVNCTEPTAMGTGYKYNNSGRTGNRSGTRERPRARLARNKARVSRSIPVVPLAAWSSPWYFPFFAIDTPLELF
jgi:hypothetical protein